MNIRSGEVSDAGERLFLQELAYRSEAEIYNDFQIPLLTQALEDLRQDFQRLVFLKATLDGRTEGSVRAFVKDGTCFISMLVVLPDYQNQGIGTALIAEIESRFRGAKRYELFTGDKSRKNIRLCERLGHRILRGRG